MQTVATSGATTSSPAAADGAQCRIESGRLPDRIETLRDLATLGGTRFRWSSTVPPAGFEPATCRLGVRRTTVHRRSMSAEALLRGILACVTTVADRSSTEPLIETLGVDCSVQVRGVAVHASAVRPGGMAVVGLLI